MLSTQREYNKKTVNLMTQLDSVTELSKYCTVNLSHVFHLSLKSNTAWICTKLWYIFQRGKRGSVFTWKTSIPKSKIIVWHKEKFAEYQDHYGRGWFIPDCCLIEQYEKINHMNSKNSNFFDDSNATNQTFWLLLDK